MLLQLRKHDGSEEEIEVLRSAFAREIATSFDWDAERRRFEQLAESEAESCVPCVAFRDDAGRQGRPHEVSAHLPCIAFMDDAGRVLEFGPNSDDTFWVSYRYSTMKSTFGFCPVDYQHEQRLEECAFDAALDLLDRHYIGGHHDIVSALPAEQESNDST